MYDNKIIGLNQSNFVNSKTPIIKIKLNLPSNTPMNDTLYLASNLNGWNCADSDYTFTRTSNTTAEIMITVPEKFDGNIEYKVTRGSWNKSECNENGAGNVGEHGTQNHSVDISGSGYSSIDIQGWTDL